MMIILLLFLQKQSLAFAVYLFGIGTLLYTYTYIYIYRSNRATQGSLLGLAVRLTSSHCSRSLLTLY